MNESTSAPPESAPRQSISHIDALRQHLKTAKTLRQMALSDPANAAARQALRAWQAERLARTHADLLASPRCGAAAQFFLSDLYGPKDFSRRDDEVERILPLLTTLLPPSALEAIALAVEVDALTESLDAALVKLLRQGDRPLCIDEQVYATAFRALDRRAERERQITLIRQTGETLAVVARAPLVSGLLRMMRAPAHAAGLGELQTFLEHGLDAFRAMGRASRDFLDAIETRETALLDRLLNDAPNPFTEQTHANV